MSDDVTELEPTAAQIIGCPRVGCDHSMAAYGGTIRHHDDGSHTFSYSADRRPLIIDDRFVTVEVSDAIAIILNEFTRTHREQLDALLAPHGIALDEITIPTYERIVWREAE